jgi:[acyl-carrier-protein] S-malonyltransferase
MPSVVLLFPGQGSQVPGMGKDLVERFAAAHDVFDAADDAIGTPLSRLCFEGPAEELTRTLNAQPALLTHGAAVWAVVRSVLAPMVVAAAGHSLGEFTAYHAADALALPEAVRLVRTRGQLMFEAGTKRPGAMAAILGEMDITGENLCALASTDGVVVPANFNSPGQLVVSGEGARGEADDPAQCERRVSFTPSCRGCCWSRGGDRPRASRESALSSLRERKFATH